MLQINDLTITHKKDLRTLLSGFRLVLNEGDKAVLIGEEGDGKSTLLKWIYDPKLPEPYVEARGERVLGGERLAWLPQELPEGEREKSVYAFSWRRRPSTPARPRSWDGWRRSSAFPRTSFSATGPWGPSPAGRR